MVVFVVVVEREEKQWVLIAEEGVGGGGEAGVGSGGCWVWRDARRRVRAAAP